MNYNDHATLTKVSLGDGRVEPSAPPAPPELVHPPSYEEAVTQSSAACSVPQPQPGCYYPPQVIMSQPAPFVHQQPPYPQQQPVAYCPAPGMAQVRTLPVGPKPLKAVCPWCSKEIITRVEYKNKYAPHICCFVLLTSVVCACCSCLPYLLCPKERDEHFCPSCGASLGVYIHRS